MSEKRAATNTVTTSLNSELQGYSEQYRQIKQEAKEFLDKMSDAQFNWSDQPGGWTIGQCFEHLNAVGQDFAGRIDKMIEEGRAKGLLSPGPFRHGFIGNMLVKFVEPPMKLKVKSPKVY